MKTETKKLRYKGFKYAPKLSYSRSRLRRCKVFTSLIKLIPTSSMSGLSLSKVLFRYTNTTQLRYAAILAIIQLTLLVNATGQQVGSKPESINKIDKIDTKQRKTTGKERVIEKKIDIDFRPEVNIKVYDTKTEILPARGNEIVAKVIFTAITENNDDLKALENAMINNLITKTGNKVSIKLDFYKTMNSTISPIKWKTVIKLKDNTKIKLSEFQIKEIKIYVPADLDMTINAKYSKVNLNFSVNGNLKINGYDIVMSAKSISNKLNVDAKYSKFEFITAGNTQLDLYESKIRVKQLNNVNANSKYSHIYIGVANTLNLTGYEDRVNIGNVPKVQIVGKYCEVEIEKNRYIDANLYEGSLKINDPKEVKLSAKYLEAEFGKLNKLKITDGYETDLEISEIDTLISVNSKYNKFDVEKLNYLLNIDGYEDDIKLGLVSGGFKKIWVSGKYMVLKMTVPNKTAYKFYGNIQYPDLSINKLDYRIVYHDKESSRLKFEYYKGQENPKSEIKINGYEMDIKINHLKNSVQ